MKQHKGSSIAIGIATALIAANALFIGYLVDKTVNNRDYEYVNVVNSPVVEDNTDEKQSNNVDVNEIYEYISSKNSVNGNGVKVIFTEDTASIEESERLYSNKVQNDKIVEGTSQEDKLPEYEALQDDEYEKGKIVVTGAKGALKDNTFDKFYDYARKVETSGGKISFMMLDPETGASVSYNSEELMKPCCTIKAGVALAVADAIEKGEASWDDMLTFQEWNKTQGSNVIQKLYRPGQRLSLQDVLHYTLNKSCNNGYYMLVDYLGRDKINTVLDGIGYENLDPQRYGFNPTTAHDIARVWEEIYTKGHEEGEKLNSAIKNGENVDINDYSAYAVIYNEFLKADYSDLKDYYFKGMKSAHKSGWSTGASNARNDAGVVYYEVEDTSYTPATDIEGKYTEEVPLIVVIMNAPYGKPSSELTSALTEIIDDYVECRNVLIMEQDSEMGN